MVCKTHNAKHRRIKRTQTSENHKIYSQQNKLDTEKNIQENKI